jgi:hypothetical protein
MDILVMPCKKGMWCMQKFMTMLVVLAGTGLSFGCADGGDASVEASKTEPDVAQSEQAFYYGANWALPPISSIASDNPGNGNPALEVCQIKMTDGTRQPGKLYAGTCRVEYGGGYQSSTSYKLLYNDGQYAWTEGRYGLPSNAVVGDTGGALPGQPNTHVYICEVLLHGYWHPGKWWKDACAIEYDNSGRRVVANGWLDVLKFLTHP